MKNLLTPQVLLHFVLATLVFGATEASAVSNEHRPVCSADGSRMIYMLQTERTNDDWELYLLDIESNVRSRLTSHKGWDGYAVWSPDSSRIIFDREISPDKPKRPWIMELEGRTSKPLGQYPGWLSITDWSSDNQLLAFHELYGQRDLVILDLAGKIVEKLTDTNQQSEHDAHFSPDRKMIAYANGDLEGAETSLELLNLKDKSHTVLRTSIGRIYGLSWSPSGEKIAFVDAPEGEDDDADIFTYTFADQSFKQVTDDPAWDHMPMFCGNDQTLYFTSYRSGEEKIYQLDPDPKPYLQIRRAGE